MSEKLTVTIVGGGNSAHVLIPFLTAAGHKVHLMTRRPTEWQDKVICEVQCGLTGDKQKVCEGLISKKSSDPAEVIPDADAIILCMPVAAYRNALMRLAPFISRSKKEVFVGTIYGQAGFNWMIHEMERENNLTNIVGFAVGLIPWICRTLEYGSRSANYGGKEVNVVAVTPYDKFDRLNELLLEDICYKPMGKGKFVQACSFLSLTLSVDNQIIHPSRCYGLYTKDGGQWKSLEEVPYFYRDFDDLSADNIRKMDADYTIVRDAVRKRFPDRDFKYMLDYLELERLTHKSANVDIKMSLKESKQLGLIKTPTYDVGDGTRALDIHSRFFTDDIPYGILIAKWIGEKLNVKTPFIDEVIFWAQKLRGERFLKPDGTINMEYCLRDKHTSGLPESYGITDIGGILD
jgi:hypothetical protein